MSELFQAYVRVEQIIWIPGAVVFPDNRPEVFDAFCDDVFGGASWANRSIFEQLPEMSCFVDLVPEVDPKLVVEALQIEGREGFFVQAAAPILHLPVNGGRYSFSWACRRTEWFYAPTTEVVKGVVSRWAKYMHETDRQNADASDAQ